MCYTILRYQPILSAIYWIGYQRFYLQTLLNEIETFCVDFIAQFNPIILTLIPNAYEEEKKHLRIFRHLLNLNLE